jgi:uncharacterized protein
LKLIITEKERGPENLMPEHIEINSHKIARGEDKIIYLSIARLPTYTNIDLPIRIIRGVEKGPVLLLSGGLHGDEINGIEIVRRMLAKKMVVPDAGTVIAIPLMNIYGFIQNVRGVPDGKDINRSFPGNKRGSLANLVAYTIMNEIIPKIDYGIDFHTGGASRSNYPQIRCDFSIERNVELAKAFGAPIILQSSLINKSFRKAANSKGKHILVYETGESLRFDEDGIQEAIDGTMRLMKYLGMKKSGPDPRESEIFNRSVWVRAHFAGLFHPKVKLGDDISVRQQLGTITDPYGSENFRIVSKHSGKVIGLNYNPVVHKGDAIFHIAKKA